MNKFDVRITLGDQLIAAVLICSAFGKISWWWFWGLNLLALLTAIISKKHIIKVTTKEDK